MTAKKDEANNTSHVPDVSDSERKSAEKEGVKQEYAESARTSLKASTGVENYINPDRWPGRHESQQVAGLLDLGLDAFEEALDAKAPRPVSEDKVAGLIELERSGKNRKQYVEILCKRLGVKSVYEVTSAGPGYMNEVAPTSSLLKPAS